MLPCIREKNDTVTDRPKGCPFFLQMQEIRFSTAGMR